MSDKIMITVMGANKVGIVAGVTRRLSELAIDIVDIRQSIFENDIFAMIMLVNAEGSSLTIEQLKDELKRVGDELQVKIYAQHEDIFRYMHRI